MGGSLCYCPGRVLEVQADRRSRCEACLLWCPQIYHGVWSQGLRGGRERKVEGPEGQVHVAVRPHRQDWTQEASARQRVDRGAQGGDPAAQPLLRDQGCQARPGPRSCCLNSCLYTLISHNHVLSVKHWKSSLSPRSLIDSLS